MMNIMYEIPSQSDITKVSITQEMVYSNLDQVVVSDLKAAS